MPRLASPELCGLTSFISGLCIAMMMLYRRPNNLSSSRSITWTLMGFIMLTVVAVWFIISCHNNFIHNPLDYEKADMLPIIKTMASRWLNGAPVYEIIPEIWGGMKPIYLPAMWSPFSLPLLLGIDIRWMTVIPFIVAVYLLVYLTRKNVKPINLLFLIGSLFMILSFFINEGKNIFILTEEGIVYAYYLLLAIAIIKKNNIGIGIALSLCLLSRYIILGFSIPLIITAVLSLKNIENRHLILGLAASSLILIIASNSVIELIEFIKLPGKYLTNLLENPVRYKDNATEVRHSFFYLFYPNKIKLFSSISIILTFLIPLILFITNYKYLLSNRTFFLLGGVKLSMVVFFGFLILPYNYLAFSSALFSIAICYFYSLDLGDGKVYKIK